MQLTQTTLGIRYRKKKKQGKNTRKVKKVSTLTHKKTRGEFMWLGEAVIRSCR